MCGGVLGEMFKGVDDVANQINPLHHFMGKAADVAGDVWKPLGKAGHWGNDHPAEAAAMAAAGWGAFAGGAGLAGMGADAGMGAGGVAADSGSVNLFADAVPGAGGDVGASSGIGMGATTGADSANSGASWLSSLFSGGGSGGGGGFGMNLGTAKNGLGAMQVLSSLYGMEQQRKLSKAATAQSVSGAGLQAVQRSMAAQGYQGSGNMATALSKYGADAYGANLQQQQASLSNTMGGLGLLTAGMGNLAGWGTGGKP